MEVKSRIIIGQFHDDIEIQFHITLVNVTNYMQDVSLIIPALYGI